LIVIATHSLPLLNGKGSFDCAVVIGLKRKM